MSSTNGHAKAVTKTISWTRPMLKRFKVAALDARKKQQDAFVFDGNDFVTDYAFYLIQYLEGELAK